MRIFAWMMALEETPDGGDGDVLRGVGVGARAVTGVVRVVDAPEGLAALRHGEVLVCRITSPEWSVALGRAGAIVTNEGALLLTPCDHRAEYEIPAVLGAADACARLATGDTVRVDPATGTVTRLTAAPSM
ncbi:MAG: PEP-utilizing enzyme [Polyangiales bacterium]